MKKFGRYLLDTNIVSELRKARPNRNVVSFVESADEPRLYISALTLGELHKGAESKRPSDPAVASLLLNWIAETERRFADRVLPVDTAVAQVWGMLSADGSRPIIDTLIAATAIANGLTLVTRNTADFRGLDLELVNPWNDQV